MTQQTMFVEHDSDVRAADVVAEEIQETLEVGEEEPRRPEEELETEEEMETVAGEVVEDGEPTITVSNLYGDDAQVAAMAERVMMVAPWVHYKINGQPKQMTKKEVSLAIRRCMALGVDPLNPHEIQIWRDKKGMHAWLAYTLMTQWIRNMHGGHTAPRYRPLSAEEKEFRGLASNDHAVECTLIMRSDIPNIIDLVKDAGFEPEEARDHFTSAAPLPSTPTTGNTTGLPPTAAPSNGSWRSARWSIATAATSGSRAGRRSRSCAASVETSPCCPRTSRVPSTCCRTTAPPPPCGTPRSGSA